LLNDGLSIDTDTDSDSKKCGGIHSDTWTYNQGIFLVTLTQISQITKNSTYSDIAFKIVDGVMNPAN